MMKKTGVCAFLVLLVVCLSSIASEGHSVLCPWTRAFMGPLQDKLVEHGFFAINYDPELGEFTNMFVLTDGNRNIIDPIEELGIHVNTVVGDRLTARVPLDKIDALTQVDGVIYVQASPLRQPLNDLAASETGAVAVQSGSAPLPRAYTGTNSLVGVIDSGIDLGHPDFYVGTATRIQYLWDQLDASSGHPPSGYTYGSEWTAAQIDGGTCVETDENPDGGGHGTHVAGSAAGNGAASSGNYAGIAPTSDIIFVKTPMDDVSLVDATAYCFNKGSAIGKPISVNMSIGGHYGPHDGTGMGSSMISDLTGAGKIISIAAGNENGDYGHAGYTVTSGDYLATSYISGYTDFAGMDIWYPASGNIDFSIGVYDPFSDMSYYTYDVPPGDSIWVLIEDDYYWPLAWVMIVATETASPLNGDRHVSIMVGNEGPGGIDPDIDLSAVELSLWTIGSGYFDAWALAGSYFDPTDYGLPWIPGDNACMVGMPGDAVEAITVAAHNTRNSWTDIDATAHSEPDEVIGDIASFSSHGPTRDGRTKPEISAPGQFIISTLSDDLPGFPADPDLRECMIDLYYQKMQGTSMATPMVTGAIALMLERDATLTPTEAFNILAGTAVTDAYTGTVPNYVWGYGKMDIFAAMCVTDINENVKTNKPEFPTLGENFPNPFNSATNIGYYLPDACRVSIGIYDINGRMVDEIVDEFQSSGIHRVVYSPDASENDNLASGAYFIKLDADDQTETRKMIYLK